MFQHLQAGLKERLREHGRGKKKSVLPMCGCREREGGELDSVPSPGALE